jgi:hypothetical protein
MIPMLDCSVLLLTFAEAEMIPRPVRTSGTDECS